MQSATLTPSQSTPPQLSLTSPSTLLDIDVVNATTFNKSLRFDCITSSTLYPSFDQSQPQYLLATTTTSPAATTALAYNTDLPNIIPPEYHQYLDMFSKVEADKLPPHHTYNHQIPLEEVKTLPLGPIYSLSEHELKTLQEYLEENLAKGFISPLDSPAASPILFVKKKDGFLCLCIDYRSLNWITICNRYPFPLIDELLDQLREAHLTNAPASFQHLMNDMFKDMLDRSLIIYLDNLLIYFSTLEQHQLHVSAVLTRLRQAGLYAKAEKCQFSTSQTKFLWFVVSDQGVSMDPSKTEVITNWPLLHKEAQSAPFTWNNKAQGAFVQLCSSFGSNTILHHFDPTRPITVETNASDFVVAAILSQTFGQGIWHPITFFSKKLNLVQLN
ncbi:hypothetical protein NDA13_006277 [Ustilago tritici]|nr:hypothetical protein NDA13_006277 [Ustilago tritici]